MFALAFGGPSVLGAELRQRALAAGCVTFSDRSDSWLGGQFPVVPTSLGARWIDGTVEVMQDGDALRLTSTAPSQRPLFVYRRKREVLATSSLELLVDTVRPTISPSGLAACILSMGLPDRLPFEDIERIPGGSTWRFEGDTVRTEMAGYQKRRQVPASSREAARVLEDALFDAVGRVVGSCSGKVGVFLSGGLDSSAVIAALSEHVPSARIVAVTWALDPRHGDRPFVDAWQRRLGIDVHPVTAADSAPLVADSLVLAAAPTALMTGAFERAAMRRARRHGAEVMLTGVGGDESFSGCLQAAVRDEASWPEQIRRCLFAELPWGGTPSERLAELWLRPRVRALIPRRVREASFFRTALRQLPMQTASLRRRLHDAAALHVRSVQAVPTSAAERWLDATSRPFWSEMGELRRQLEAAEQMPRFDIPLDSALHDVLASIPPRYLFEDARHRGLLRRVLQGRAPQAVTSRSDKADFDEFALEMLRLARVSTAWASLARMQRLALLDLAPLGGLGPGWQVPTTPEALSRLLVEWPFLTAEAFTERYS